ncbi:MAG: redoxin family protein, partial [Bacteroidota bacterium]
MKIILLSLIFSIPFLLNAQKDHPEVNMLEIGEQAPGFNLPGTDGERYQLEDFDDKDILVVLFTCNHCPTAQAYEDKFIKMVNDYSGKGVGFVAISPNSNEALSLAECGYSDLDDSFESMQIRARYKSFNFPYLYDGDDHEASIKYGPQATPHVFVFDNERKLRYRGRIDDTENPYVEPDSKDLINTLDALLTDKNPDPATTKTFGCSTKWSWKDEWTKTLQKKWAEEEVSLVDIDVPGIQKVIENNTENLRLVNVWATWCGPCVIEFPELVNIYRMYSGRDFELITISADKPSQK